VARAARGDERAFAEIYACCEPGVRRYVRTVVRNEWDVDDVTQEIFVKVFTGLPRYEPRATFSAWMLRVARNAAIDHLRRMGARPICEEVDQQAALDDTGPRCRESLRQTLAGLTDSQRQILMLRALAGFTPCEVALRVQRTPGSIGTLYHRARVAARDTLTAMEAAPSTHCAREHGEARPAGFAGWRPEAGRGGRTSPGHERADHATRTA
jgi:RNA polymerase sigma-70 factor (ECF subfamily)